VSPAEISEVLLHSKAHAAAAAAAAPGVSAAEISEVLLVGGMTRMPKVGGGVHGMSPCNMSWGTAVAAGSDPAQCTGSCICWLLQGLAVGGSQQCTSYSASGR
jgi:hypothetical protein